MFSASDRKRSGSMNITQCDNLILCRTLLLANKITKNDSSNEVTGNMSYIDAIDYRTTTAKNAYDLLNQLAYEELQRLKK